MAPPYLPGSRPDTPKPLPRSARSISDELFGSFENLLALADKRGVPYDR